MDISEFHPYILLAGVGVGGIAACLKGHITRKYERRCTCGVVWHVERICQIIPRDDGTCSIFVFARCKKCGTVRLVKSEDKRFMRSEVAWRRRFHPKEFVLRRGIFEAAGLDLDAILSPRKPVFESAPRIKIPAVHPEALPLSQARRIRPFP